MDGLVGVSTAEPEEDRGSTLPPTDHGRQLKQDFGQAYQSLGTPDSPFTEGVTEMASRDSQSLIQQGSK
jgi:hypothetical protein